MLASLSTFGGGGGALPPFLPGGGLTEIDFCTNAPCLHQGGFSPCLHLPAVRATLLHVLLMGCDWMTVTDQLLA